MTDTTTLDGPDLIEHLYGPIARQEYQHAPSSTRAHLMAYAQRLGTLNAEDFVTFTETAILDSAITGRFRGNFSAEHCKATMCHAEDRRRQVAAGHDEWCSNGSLYQRAYNAVVRNQGHPQLASITTTCDCTAGADQP